MRVGIGATPDLAGFELRARLFASEDGSVDEGPAPHEHGLAFDEGILGFELLPCRHGSGGHALHDQPLLHSKTFVRASLIDDDFGWIVGRHDLGTGVVDELEAVHHAAFVLGPLKDEAVLGIRLVLNLTGHLHELVPCFGGLVETGFLQKVGPVIEHADIGEPGNSIDFSVEGVRFDGRFEELATHFLRETVGEIQNPLVGTELSGPNDITADDVGGSASGLELGPEFVEVLAGVGRRLAEENRDSVAILFVELVYNLGNRVGGVRS